MRTTSWTGCALTGAMLATGCVTSPGTSMAARDIRRYTLEDFVDTTTMFGASFSPDERTILVSSDESGVFNAYAVATDGGQQTPLTDSTDHAVFTASYFPFDEGHGFRKKENRLRGYRAIRDFCDLHLKVTPLAHD